MKSILACALFSTALLLPTTGQALDYRISFNPSQPLVARVEVVAPPSDNIKANVRIVSRTPLTTRSSAQGVRELVSQVQCDGAALKRNEAGWMLPPRGCTRITWTVAFATLGTQGFDASAQENLFHPGSKSWVLSEPVSLLRWPGTEGARVLIRGASPVRGGMAMTDKPADPSTAPAMYLPTRDEPAEYLLIGNAPLSRLRMGEHEFTYARLAPGALDALQALERAHAQAVIRFAQTAQVPLTPSLVVWLPIDAKQGGLGATSGGHAALANVVTQKGVAAPAQLPYTLATLLQSQFALMVPSRLPLWVSTSLSEYYVRKALSFSALDAATIATMESAYLAPEATPSGTLIGFQARIESQDPDAYRLLMTEGSTFWLALDRAISLTSSGTRSLDDELPEILNAEYGSARLPVALIDRLRLAAGATAFDALQARYLGPMQ